jgi:hypothetical protein
VTGKEPPPGIPPMSFSSIATGLSSVFNLGAGCLWGERLFVINVGSLELFRAFLGFKVLGTRLDPVVIGAARVQRRRDHSVPSLPVRDRGAKILARRVPFPKDMVLSVLQIDWSSPHQHSAGPLLFGTSDHLRAMSGNH